MTIPADYQWPSCFYQKGNFSRAAASLNIEQIEGFFSNKFGCQVMLMPSARAALTAIFAFKNINRSHVVMAPKWSSKCVWDVLGRFANPTCDISTKVDFVLKLNKWGYFYQMAERSRSTLIADSVDTFFFEKKDILVDADTEIISLPKIFNCPYGGLILTRNEQLVRYIQERRAKSSITLASKQWHLRVQEHDIEEWEYHEWKNMVIAPESLPVLSACVADYNHVQETLLHRANLLAAKYPLLDMALERGRLPCVLPINADSLPVPVREKFMQRSFNFSLDQVTDDYAPACLLPLHIGVTDQQFQYWLELINE